MSKVIEQPNTLNSRMEFVEIAGTPVVVSRIGLGTWAIGVSNFSPSQIDEFRAVAPLHAAQPPYNLFERAIEQDVLPYCREHHMAMLAYGSLCRGLLSGKMTSESRFSGDDLRKGDPKFREALPRRMLKLEERRCSP